MRLLSKLVAAQRKQFSRPPFWSLPDGILGDVGSRETLENDWLRFVRELYKANGIVFAAIAVRQLVFAEARFAFQRLVQGRATELFTTDALAPLERPWPNGTTGELLARMEQDASLAGNFYAVLTPTGQIRRLRPDRVTIVTGRRFDGRVDNDRPWAVDSEVVAYLYREPVGGNRTEMFDPQQVVHYSPLPDPEAQWRGMSWLGPVLEDIQSDRAATRHKLNFFRRGAVLGTVVTYDAGIDRDTFEYFVEAFKRHEGVDNAYRTLHLGGGADVKTIGVDMRQLDLKQLQGSGETRIAVAAGVPAVVLGISEGLAGSALNAGNYAVARRRFVDGTIRPLWRIAAASLEQVIETPPGARLWYDDRDIAFLRDDAEQQASVQQRKAAAINTLVQAGFRPDAAVDAIENNDFRRLLGEHTGLVSAQMQVPPQTVAAQDESETEEE